jgi:hypothetical protein
VAGPGVKIRAKVARTRVSSPYPAEDGRIRTPVFFVFDFSLVLVPLDHGKEGVKQKAKAKSK